MTQNRLERKKEFIQKLSWFLSSEAAYKSIQLSMGNPLAVEWAELRNISPICGYGTIKETEDLLTEFLS